MISETVVIAELSAGLPAPVTMELIEFAKSLRADRKAPVRVFVLGHGIERAVAILSEIPGTAVTALVGESLALYSAEAWKEALAPRLAEIKPRFICAAHDSTGADFAPGLTVRLGAGCITAVEGAKRDGDALIFRRSVLNGKVTSDVAPNAETTVITLLPGAFRGEGAGKDSSRHGTKGAGEVSASTDATEGEARGFSGRTTAFPAKVEIIPITKLSLKSRPLGLLSAPEQDADLTAAEVVVSAGRGIKKEENLFLVRDLAALFSRSAVGASRTVCDAGWLPARLQIGQTGKTVTPRLYIACGISGALQHLVGMRGSQFVVAINSDPRAVIFQAADVCVVEDLLTFVPLLIDACKRRKKEGAA